MSWSFFFWGGGPELTARVRLPVVVFSAEGHAVKVGTLLLSEITGSCRTGLWREDTFKNPTRDDAYICMSYFVFEVADFPHAAAVRGS